MISEKVKNLTFILIFLFLSTPVFGQEEIQENSIESSLQKGIELLRKYLVEEKNWQFSSDQTQLTIENLIHFIENQPIDSTLLQLQKDSFNLQKNYVTRLPKNVADSLSIPGFYASGFLKTDLEKMGVHLQQKFKKVPVALPLEITTNIEKYVHIISPENGISLFLDSVYRMPDSLQIPEVIPDSLLESPDNYKRILTLDSLQKVYIEQKRLHYNDSIVHAYRDSVIQRLRLKKFEEEFNRQKKLLIDSVNLNNYTVLRNYNDSVVQAVNDSIAIVVNTLADYANFIDTTKIGFLNLVNERGELLLRNNSEYFTRFWLKNEQKDSLSILVKNIDKRTVQLLIDDGVTFSRFKPKQTKEFDFSTLNKTVTGLNKVTQRYEKLTPWIIGGDGTVGFTQTYSENWKKGGQSALSFLMVMKGFANYSRADGKVKWENSGEIRNGWIQPGDADSELQKNDDKFEITTRGGLSAFKKWYYSAELNFNTQFFNGYKYPTETNPEPISGFMAPSRTFFKLGLDYKPNKEFSLFLSPITAKVVYVGDTLKINQTNFSIPAGQKSLWIPGLNADLKYKKEIAKNITYETKYKMFVNYKQPFKKFDIDWENLLVMQLTDYINMRMMVHMIYDDDVKFPVFDANDVKIGEEPKLQLKQLITIGFSYKINRQVMRSKQINR